jgi:hypothetical protein
MKIEEVEEVKCIGKKFPEKTFHNSAYRKQNSLDCYQTGGLLWKGRRF